MRSFFLLAAYLAFAVVLLCRVWQAGKKGRAPGHGGVRIWIIVKNQELWIEGFVRKLFRTIRNSICLEVWIADDTSCDRTAEILHRLGRIYPVRTLSACGGLPKDGGLAGKSGPGGTLQFDVRGLAGRKLLNAPLFGHISHLDAGKPQILSN